MKNVKKRFIILTLIAILLLLTALVIAMNFVNYIYEIREADSLLDFLSKHKGELPEADESLDEVISSEVALENLYETRYFSVLLDSDGTVLSIDNGSITNLEKNTATELASEALNSERTKGFAKTYRFRKEEEKQTVRITFLDHKQKIRACFRFLRFSILCSVVGFLLISSAIIFFADRLIRPITESYEKQKRFITDAGHEIKTPLTIINANVDILEMEHGKNEGFDEVRLQCERLTALTQELVLLARMEEGQNALQTVEFPVSEVVEEAVAPFKTISENHGLLLSANIKPLLSMQGDQKSITRLVSILMDNAMKYTPAGGKVSVSLKKQGRGVALSISNDTAEPVDPQEFHHVFDRFYRMDNSRNSETGGYGIGLSVAKTIVLAHGGKISAWTTKDNKTFGITAVFS